MIMMIIAYIGYWIGGCQMKAGSFKERDLSPSVLRVGWHYNLYMLATHASSKYCQLICWLDILKHHMLFFSRDSRSPHFDSYMF